MIWSFLIEVIPTFIILFKNTCVTKVNMDIQLFRCVIIAKFCNLFQVLFMSFTVAHYFSNINKSYW